MSAFVFVSAASEVENVRGATFEFKSYKELENRSQKVSTSSHETV